MRRMMLACLLALGAAPAFGQQTVNVYNFAEFIARDQLKVFEQRTGIRVNYSTYEADEMLDAALKSEQAPYDVVVPSATPFFARQLLAGLYRTIDAPKLANWKNVDPAIAAQLDKLDPGHRHAVPWMWGTTGLGYNVAEITKRLPDAPVDSLRLLFDPAIVSKFQDCGVRIVDSPTDVFPAALKYLGLDPDSKKPEDLDRAAAAIMAIRPYVKLDTATYTTALAEGQACLVLGYSGDIIQVRRRTDGKRDIRYVLPREGALAYMTVAAIPKSAPNPQAGLRFLDFLMDPEMAAASSRVTRYANAIPAATPLMPRSITDNPLIYPPAEIRARLYAISAGTAAQMRELTLSWIEIKRSGE
ncbi:MAG TPA: extracellular solute-binding protein [Reyranella sp.]|nr:extracellular solute-binding protein [Reyranella sp.]